MVQKDRPIRKSDRALYPENLEGERAYEFLETQFVQWTVFPKGKGLVPRLGRFQTRFRRNLPVRMLVTSIRGQIIRLITRPNHFRIDAAVDRGHDLGLGKGFMHLRQAKMNGFFVQKIDLVQEDNRSKPPISRTGRFPLSFPFRELRSGQWG
jgi:hypothetical protein